MLPKRYEPLTASVMPGGFGSVQPFRDTYLDRVVLFKSMKDNKDNGQLINEIRGLSKARSRHVVEIYDVIYDSRGDVAGVVIENLTGRGYEGFCTEAASNIHGYILVLYQIASALADMHAAGVVHRDIKLDNLKCSAAGVLKVFDFGISVASDDYVTRNNRGTFVYAAPELYEQNAAILPGMDIYALGICAWALATPIGNFPAALMERPPQATSRAPSLLDFLAALPGGVANMLDRCLEPNPKARPNAEEVRNELKRHLVRGRHKGIFVQDARAVFELSATKPMVRLQIGSLGAIRVAYDELDFHVLETTEHVYINNERAEVGDLLHGSCVLAFGDPSLGGRRQWVTFSSAHPEVVI